MLRKQNSDVNRYVISRELLRHISKIRFGSKLAIAVLSLHIQNLELKLNPAWFRMAPPGYRTTILLSSTASLGTIPTEVRTTQLRSAMVLSGNGVKHQGPSLLGSPCLHRNTDARQVPTPPPFPARGSTEFNVRVRPDNTRLCVPSLLL
jgi:hypothetical protein